MSQLAERLRKKYPDDALERLGRAEHAYYSTHGDYLPELARLLLIERSERAALADALRRKCVLDTYGITIDNLHDDFDRWLRIVSSDDEIAAWFGEPLEPYVLADLAALEGQA